MGKKIEKPVVVATDSPVADTTTTPFCCKLQQLGIDSLAQAAATDRAARRAWRERLTG